MKSDILLSKSDDLFGSFAKHLMNLNYPFVGGAERSSCINPDGEFRFMFYNRAETPSFFEKYEIPEEARNLSYKFAYMIECRSEKLFCDIVSSTPSDIDIIVCDSNGVLFRPGELKPNLITL